MHDRPSSTPIVAGTAPAARTRRLAREADLDPAGREAVRDEGRLERDDRAPSSRAACTSSAIRISSFTARAYRPADAIGIAPVRCTQRAAASSARSAPPTIQPAASASPAPVVSTTSVTVERRTLVAVERATHVHRASGSTSAPGRLPPKIPSSSSLANTTSGRRPFTRARNRSAPYSRIALQEDEVDADASARCPGELDRAARGGSHRLGQERVPGDVKVVAGEVVRLQLGRLERRRDTPVGEHRALATLLDERDDDAVPRRLHGAHQLDADALERLSGQAALGVVCPLADPPGGGAECR